MHKTWLRDVANTQADDFMHQQFLAKDPRIYLDNSSFSIIAPPHDGGLCSALPEYSKKADYFSATYWWSYCESAGMQPYRAENHSVFPKVFPYMLVFPKTKQTNKNPTSKTYCYARNFQRDLILKFPLIWPPQISA